MKRIIAFFTFLISFLSFAQQSDKVVLNWTDNPLYFSEGNKVNIPNFQPENFNYNDSNRSLFFAKKIEVSSTTSESSLQISDVEYETISQESLGFLDAKFIASTINANLENSQARDVNYAVLTFSPIIKDGNTFKRVKSLTYTFNYGASSKNNINSRNALAISSSVLKNGIWKKFYVEKSGVYKISKAFLTSLGFNVNVDPRTIQIFGNGGRMIPLLNATPYPEDLIEKDRKSVV